MRHGAVGHPQSKGAAERFNRTLLTLIRKTVQSRDWRVDLDMLLFYYRTRPHRSDNRSEFCNRVFSSLLDKFGVHVCRGAVGPQSQRAAERFNRTLIRKTVQFQDWRVDLDMLLFYYRTRIHSGLGVSPMMAMYGWETRDLIVESHSLPQERFTYTPEFLCGYSPKIIVQFAKHLDAVSYHHRSRWSNKKSLQTCPQT